jgi:hypothetical protein
MTTDARFRDTLKSLLAALGSSDPTRRQKVRRIIRDTLAVNQKSWNDLITSLRFGGQHSEKLKKLFVMLGQDATTLRAGLSHSWAEQEQIELVAGGVISEPSIWVLLLLGFAA